MTAVQSIKSTLGKTYRLIDANGNPYMSLEKGLFGGNNKLRIYGRLNCKNVINWIKKGHYMQNRVFFRDEKTAISAGYRPCAKCMPEEYKLWKQNPEEFVRGKLYTVG